MQQANDRKFSTNEQRWEALVGRNSEADGAFFYGVKTTRIYCRPACASRLPNRENVLFFDSYTAAENAGFRACKRCQPQINLPRQQKVEMIANICKQIESSEDSISLEKLATTAGFSPFHFQRLFKEIVGISPKQYEMALRAKKVRHELAGNSSITQAVYNAGFRASSSFYNQATEILGMQPMDYRKGGTGVTIRYAVKPSDLGWVLVAATEGGICAIQFSDDSKTAIAQLQECFPKALFSANDPEFDRWVEEVIAFIKTPQPELNLPLDIQGTVFQQKVWQALRAIPLGKTASYAEIAQRLGNPKAVRAVARACATNNIAVAIPCHRVVGSNGSLTGYRWGIDRKQALLAIEAAQQKSNANQFEITPANIATCTEVSLKQADLSLTKITSLGGT